MGTATNETLNVIRSTGYGNDRFGPCEICRKHCSEHHVMQLMRVYVREDGLRYLSPIGGGSFGHRECISAGMLNIVENTAIKRLRHLLLAPLNEDFAQ